MPKIKQCVVYGIKDPRSGMFVYVGQTHNFEQRVKGHLRQRKRPNIRTENIKTWLFDILQAGLMPEFIVLQIAKDDPDSLGLEDVWVERLAGQGHRLLNRWRRHRQAVKANLPPS